LHSEAAAAATNAAPTLSTFTSPTALAATGATLV